MRQPLGQHFLRSEGILEHILQSADLQPTDVALEIGPGKGALTERLIPRVAHTIAVELDRTLAPQLQERWGGNPSVRIIHADFLTVSLEELDKHFPTTENFKVLGNLPYSITSPIFQKLFTWPKWKIGVFLIQKEVADRMMARHGSKQFGVLTLATQLDATVEKIRLVPPGAFQPPPQVQSMVIRLLRRDQPLLPRPLHPAYFDFVHGAFAHRRKTLANSLAFHSGKEASVIATWLGQNGIDPRARAESLAITDYVRLAKPWSIFRR